MRAIWTRLAPGIAALALTLASGAANAWMCDFLTGGGFIINPTSPNGAKANFGVGGGCSKDGTPTWGHLEYIDHGTGLNVHWTSITAYKEWDTSSSPKGRPTGARLICGTARTNLPSPNDNVNFVVLARDAGEPGVNDQFDIRVRNQAGMIVYDTTTQCFPHFLGSTRPCAPGDGGGGNIQLHKPNPSTTGSFGGSCPAL